MADSRRRGGVVVVPLVGSTAVGTVIGEVLDDPNALGLDAAFAALFLALAMPYPPRWGARVRGARGRDHTRADPVHPAGVPIIAASAACLLGLARGFHACVSFPFSW